MADINVERKGPSIWPWVIGLLVLALLIWAIAEMVDTDERVAVEEQPVEEVTEPPAAVPEPGAVAPEAGLEQPGFAIEEAADVETLLPIDSEDMDRPVLVTGEVVGTPTPRGFWVRTATEANDVIFVQAPAWTEAGEPMRVEDIDAGQQVSIAGVVRRMPSDQATRSMDEAELRTEQDFDTWNVHSDFMVANQPQDTQARPGQQPMQPGDTVDGRY